MKNGLFWFNHDLRVNDNPALAKLNSEVDKLCCCFVIESAWYQPETRGFGPAVGKKMSRNRWHFLKQSLQQLTALLAQQDIQLIVMMGSPVKLIAKLMEQVDIHCLGFSQHVGFYEQRNIAQLKKQLKETGKKVEFISTWSNTLFTEQDAAPLVELDKSFSRFRNKVEKAKLHHNIPLCDNSIQLQPPLPLLPALLTQPYVVNELDSVDAYLGAKTEPSEISGGCISAQQHVENYFASGAASTYKKTRNQLHGNHFATGFSPWLASGCINPKEVWRHLLDYELQFGANDSTNWIGFELIWREFFHWLALKQEAKLYQFKGLRDASPNTSFYPERFKKWCSGATPYPLINALMKQLNHTGLMSNRGRQIVASYLVNELQLDWRYGASYFESQLLDYDVASNWGNWQYIAGVGVDPRGGRWFDIEKQTTLYDPDRSFINAWGGNLSSTNSPLDSVDATDWPVQIN